MTEWWEGPSGPRRSLEPPAGPSIQPREVCSRRTRTPKVSGPSRMHRSPTPVIQMREIGTHPSDFGNQRLAGCRRCETPIGPSRPAPWAPARSSTVYFVSMIRLSEVDYATRGLSVRRAFAEAAEAAAPLPKPLRAPLSLRWAGRDIITADIFEVPNAGRFRLEFLEVDAAVRQGVDIQAQPGSELDNGTREPLLRTWYEPDLPQSVEYEYLAEDGLMRTCNIYEVARVGEIRAERWTENAAMWVDEISKSDRVYHCSHGISGSPAAFDALVYRLTIL